MKKLIGILTLGIAALFVTPAAEARSHRSSRVYVEYHRSCRGPAYVERYVAYYDSCGHPVFRSRVVPVHRHRGSRPAPVCRPGVTVHFGHDRR